jgi:hypothetical protein
MRLIGKQVMTFMSRFFTPLAHHHGTGETSTPFRTASSRATSIKSMFPIGLSVQHYEEPSEDVRPFADRFFNLIREFEAEGCPVTVQYEEIATTIPG